MNESNEVSFHIREEYIILVSNNMVMWFSLIGVKMKEGITKQ